MFSEEKEMKKELLELRCNTYAERGFGEMLIDIGKILL